MRLEQAGLRSGMRVLEVGSGGYNAALIAELVGDDGEVITIDIDIDVVGRARACLAAAGYPHASTQDQLPAPRSHSCPGCGLTTT